MNARGRTVAILQARMTSSRLPGKVLLPVAGAPMLLRQLERMRRASSVDQIVVATSEDLSDDDLAFTVVDAGYDCVRGSLTDVLGRFVTAADEYEPDAVVRLTADCPLISPAVIDEIVQAFQARTCDYLSNTLQPTYPDGLDVEVMTAAAIRDIANSSTDPDEREHVTLGIYRHPERFSVENYTDPSGRDNSQLRWTVDSPDDFEFVSAVYQHLFSVNPEFEYDDILNLLAQHPQLSRDASHAARNEALNGLDVGAMQHPGSSS